ncbi:mucin-16 [Glossophaga mutica]
MALWNRSIYKHMHRRDRQRPGPQRPAQLSLSHPQQRRHRLTQALNYSTAPGNATWPEASPKFKTGSPLAPTTVSAPATSLAASPQLALASSPPPPVETTTPASAGKMGTDEVSYSSASQLEMPGPPPHTAAPEIEGAPSSAHLLLPHAVKELRPQTAMQDQSPPAQLLLLEGSPAVEHTNPGVKTGLAKTPLGASTSSESKSEPPWTSASPPSEAPDNRGAAGTVASAANRPVYESSSWLTSGPSTPPAAVYSAGHITPAGPWTSDGPDSAATASLLGVARETASSPPAATSPTEPASSMAPNLRGTNTSQLVSSATETITVFSSVPIEGGFSPTSLSPETSFSSPLLVRTTDMVSRSSESGASFSPSLHSPSNEILVVSETSSTGAGATRLSRNTGVTGMGTSSSGHALRSSVPVSSEPSGITYPMDSISPTPPSPGAEASSALPTMTVPPDVLTLATSLVTSSGTEAKTTFLTRTEFLHESDTTVSLVSHPAQSSPFFSTSTASVSHTETHSAPSMATSPGAEASSALPGETVETVVTGVVTSAATSSGGETGTTAATLTTSQLHPETTGPWPSPSDTQARSAVPTLPVSTPDTDTAMSMVTRPSETSLMVSQTTFTVSHSASDRLSSTATSSGAEVPSGFPTVTVPLDALSMATSRLTRSGTEARTTLSTRTASTDESDPKISSVTGPAESSSTVPRAATSISNTDSDSTAPTGPRPGTDTSPAGPSIPVSSEVPGLVTSQVPRSGTDASSVFPPLTLSPPEQATTASGVTRPAAHTISAVPTMTGSPDVSGVVSSRVTGAREGTSPTFAPLTDVSRELDTTEASSAVPSLTASPEDPVASTSLVTQSSDTSPSFPRGTSSVSNSESDTAPSMATSAGAEALSRLPGRTEETLVPGELTSQATSSGAETTTSTSTLTDDQVHLETTASWATTHLETETRSAVPTLTESPGEPETTVSSVTPPGAQSSSILSTLAISPGVSGVEFSQVSSSRAETATTLPAVTDSPPEPQTAASRGTHPASEATSTVPTVTVSAHEPHTAASREYSPTTSPSVSRRTPNSSHSELDSISPTPPSPGAEARSALPTMTVPPDVLTLATSLVTSSGTEAKTTFLTRTESLHESDTTVSLVSHPAQSSPFFSTSTASVSHTETHSAPSMATGPGAEASSALPGETVETVVTGVVTSAATSSGGETGTTAATLTTSQLHPETTGPWPSPSDTQARSAVPTLPVSTPDTDTAMSMATQLPETTLTVSQTTCSASHGESESTTSKSTYFRTEGSSVPASPSVSSGVSGKVTSQVSTAAPDSTMATATPTVFPGEPATAVSLVTHPSAERNTSFPPVTFFPHSPDTSASPSTHSGWEVSAGSPTETISLGPLKTTSSLFTTLVNDTSRVDLASTASLRVPVGTATLSTHAEINHSTTVSASTVFHGSSETTGFLATSPASGAGTGIPALPASPGVVEPASSPGTTGKPYTVTSWTTQTSPPATSAGLSEFSQTVTGGTVTLMTSTTGHEGSSPTPTLKTATLESTKLAATGSGPTMAKTTATFSALSESSFVPVTTPEMSMSAYVSVTSGTTTIPLLMPFIVNFTITNLHYREDMGNLGSKIFNATERGLQQLLGPLFKNSSIGSLYAGCRLASLRAEEEGTSTTVDVVCTHHPGPTGSGLDREQLYWELSQQTHGATRLGPYTLDRNSLFVSGYNHRYWIPTTGTLVTSTFTPGPTASVSPTPSSTAADVGPAPVPFTLNFTITNMLYIPDMRHPGSAKFNSTERVLNRLLSPLFKKTSIGPLYSGCRLAQLRTEKDGETTGVDIVCTYHPDPMGPGLDVEELYQELSQLTHGVTQLGTYTMDKDSLYVNGYNHRSWTPTTSSYTHGTSASTLSATVTSTLFPRTSLVPAPFSSSTAAPLLPFTLNFTITNLHYEEAMRHRGSRKFNTTERVLQRLLKSVFRNSSLRLLYAGCRLASLSPEKEETATRVDIICAHRPDPEGPGLDRERLYWELRQLTHGITVLGPYTLDGDSLWVNGFTHRSPTLFTSTPGTSMVDLGTLGTPSSFSSPPAAVTSTIPPATSGTPVPVSTVSIATVPALVPFTLNFTVTNLRYEEDMGRIGSWKFNTTERVLQRLLRILFKKSRVGPLSMGCRLTMLRPRKDGTATGVDIVCTHRPDPGGPGLDSEQLYWELSQRTNGVTRLGPYTLDQDSLYVNGYTHQTRTTTPSISAGIPTPSSRPTAPGPALVSFTLNFTITNLHHTEDMQPGSAKFNSTESLLQYLLKPLFTNSSIGSLYTGCRLATLRPEKGGAATGVDAICTHRADPAGLILDREQLYWELSHQTHGVTRLGPYVLDRDRLYVNGYTGPASTSIPSVSVTSTPSLGSSSAPMSSSSTASGPALVPLTLNFTITNLHYMEDMQFPGSVKFNKIEKILQHLLRALFKNTSVSLLYSSCRLTLLRPERDGAATSVDIACNHRPDPAGPGLDRERLYWELSQLTQSVTKLGPYTLDQDSLYVNGYTHQTSETTPHATGPPPVPFTLNFTITNLHYVEDMWPPGSLKFNATEKFLQRLLKQLFKKTSVGALFSGCSLTLLRPRKDGAATGVDVVCTHRPDPGGPRLDNERLYGELSQLTRGFTQLGPYTLDQDSFYVNGHTHQTQTSTPRSHTHLVSATTTKTTGPTLLFFTLNFTITNMHYTGDMGHPGSLKFNSTERILQHQLRLLFRNTRVGPLSSHCRLASLRLEKHGAATGVDIVCTYLSDLAGPGLDSEQLYWELSHQTHGVTRLGSFTLDKDSLHVNGYTYGATALTPTSAEVNEEPFTLNFTISNLHYSADMGHPGSLKFNITNTLMQHLLSRLFWRSSLGSRYTGCRVTSLRSVKNGAKTRVDFLCTYRQPPSGPGLPVEQVFHELSWQTQGITRLGPYSLDKDSLYLNGYNERGPDVPPTTPEPVTTFLPTSSSPVQPEATTALLRNLETLTLNFTISNLQYSADMSNGSSMFNSTERVLQHLLRSLFKKSSLGPYYVDFRLISLRPEKGGAATSVGVICTYHPNPLDYGLDRDRLYWELSQLTHRVTQLGPYTLVPGSLFVNGYAPQSAFIQSEYQLNFRIINWNLSNPDPMSSEYTALLRDIQDKVTKLYKGSQLQDVFHSCLVTNLKLGSMSVTIRELFSSSADPSMVKQVFLDGTFNASSHWLGATYHLADIQVTEVETAIHLPTDRPTSSPSSQHFQLNFTVTNLLYVQDIAQPGTTKHQRNKRSMENALNHLFQNSSIKSYFSDCQVLAFRSVPHSNHTGVDSLCHVSPSTQVMDRVAIYEEFLQLTQNGTQLQNFTLDRNSVLVDGYAPSRHDALTGNSDLPFWAIILTCLAGLLALVTCLICCFLVTMCRQRRREILTFGKDAWNLPHPDPRTLQ